MRRFVSLAAVLVTAVFVGGCSSAPKPEDQAALLSLSAKLDTAKERVLTAAEADEGHAQLVQLGISLADVERQRALASVWTAVQPVVTAGIPILVGMVTGGGAP